MSISYRHPSYNNKNVVCKPSVRSLQTICNFTDSLPLSPHSISSTSPKSPITAPYRQLSHHYCTYPKTVLTVCTFTRATTNSNRLFSGGSAANKLAPVIIFLLMNKLGWAHELTVSHPDKMSRATLHEFIVW
jgi:hypothetical protein